MSGHIYDVTFMLSKPGRMPLVHEAPFRVRPNPPVETKYNGGNGLSYLPIKRTRGNLDHGTAFIRQSRSDGTRAHFFGYRDATRRYVGFWINPASADHNFDPKGTFYVHTGGSLVESMRQGEQRFTQLSQFPVSLLPQQRSRAIFIQKTRTQ